jgi:hypothetical protein
VQRRTLRIGGHSLRLTAVLAFDLLILVFALGFDLIFVLVDWPIAICQLLFLI